MAEWEWPNDSHLPPGVSNVNFLFPCVKYNSGAKSQVACYGHC